MTDFGVAKARGLVLLGCGKMGGAMLSGWREAGLPLSSVTVIDPAPAPFVQDLVAQGLTLNPDTVPSAGVVLLAVKPQMMADAIPQVAHLSDALFLSIAAGSPIRWFEQVLGAGAAIIRAMPNTPAAVGAGVTALIGNVNATEDHMRLAETLARAIGTTVRLTDESQMDAVTALSGSGPAYVFHLIEAMAAAGADAGLPPDLSMTLARHTVAGAGALVAQSDESPAQLRVNVTSPGGTTAAGLGVLMEGDALTDLISRTVAAAAARGRALAEEG